jgi:hypothetical protein
LEQNVTDQLGQILPYILIASGVGILGGILAVFWRPGVGARSAVQHFAAGAVIATERNLAGVLSTQSSMSRVMPVYMNLKEEIRRIVPAGPNISVLH